MLSETKAAYIPYRNSKLTHLLQTSLGGNANTSIICHFSPASHDREETTSTLQFAARARKIMMTKVVAATSKNCWLDQTELLQACDQEVENLQARLRRSSYSSLPDGQLMPNASTSTLRHPSDMSHMSVLDLDVLLSDDNAVRLRQLQAEAAEAEALVKAFSPGLRLRVFVAVNPDGLQDEPPELVVQSWGSWPRQQQWQQQKKLLGPKTWRQPPEDEAAAPSLEWLSAEELCRRLAVLRSFVDAGVAGHGGGDTNVAAAAVNDSDLLLPPAAVPRRTAG